MLFLLISSIILEEIVSGPCGENMIYEYYVDSRILYVKGTGAIKDYDYEPQEWFTYRDALKELVISEGITRVGRLAFYYIILCEKLTIPSTVTYIGDRAFQECYKLREITLPANLTYLGTYSFAVGFEVRNITFLNPSKLSVINAFAFQDCSKLQSITLPASIIEIDQSAFSRCTELSTVFFLGDKSPKPYGIYVFADTKVEFVYVQNFYLDNHFCSYQIKYFTAPTNLPSSNATNVSKKKKKNKIKKSDIVLIFIFCEVTIIAGLLIAIIVFVYKTRYYFTIMNPIPPSITNN